MATITLTAVPPLILPWGAANFEKHELGDIFSQDTENRLRLCLNFLHREIVAHSVSFSVLGPRKSRRVQGLVNSEDGALESRCYWPKTIESGRQVRCQGEEDMSYQRTDFINVSTTVFFRIM